MLENWKPLNAWTTTDADVPSGIVASVASCAYIVNAPAAFKVTAATIEPEASGACGGRLALASDDRTSIELPTVVTVFQVLSHARTVIENGTPTTCADGVPL